ncbi:hypothetical protein LCGC14_0716160 [marine sediment metagenome]|uniref:Uncharacterized protein n=1 Tax=marine sediment metagenome TaxID=412755 RepID=A0A0F9QYT9_9ZZZZ
MLAALANRVLYLVAGNRTLGEYLPTSPCLKPLINNVSGGDFGRISTGGNVEVATHDKWP